MSCGSDSDWVDTADEEIKSTAKPEHKMSYAEEAIYKLREKLANHKHVLPEQISTEYLATILANCDYNVEDLLMQSKLVDNFSGITAYDTQEVMEKLDALTLQVSALASKQPAVADNREISVEENYHETPTDNYDKQVSYRGVREIFNDRRKSTSSNITPKPISTPVQQYKNTKSTELIDTKLATITTVGKVSGTTPTVTNQGKKVTITIDLS